MGSVYKRGNTYWIQYYYKGQLLRESSRSPMKSVARALLKKREGDLVDGRLPNLRADRTTFKEIAALFLCDYQVNGKKSLRRAQQLVDRLADQFGSYRVCEITSPCLTDYIARRQRKGAANGTINRELSALRRMFSLASQQTPPLIQLSTVPLVPKLKETNIRTGFFSLEEYRLLRAALPDHLKIPFVIAYWTGMRAGEILALRWDQVDLETGFLRLEPGTTKNEKGRTIPLTQDVLYGIQQWRTWTQQRYPNCIWICHYRGKPLRRISRRKWQAICRRVGLDGKLFHDLRRTGVRNLIRAGVPERVAMEISGHRTRSVFDRYNIVSEQDLVQAQSKLNRMSTISSTVGAPTDSQLIVSP